MAISLVATASLHIPAADPLDGRRSSPSPRPFFGGLLGLIAATLMLVALVQPLSRWAGTPMVVAVLGATAAWFETAVYVGGLVEPIEQTGFTLAPMLTGGVAAALIFWRARVRLRAATEPTRLSGPRAAETSRQGRPG